MSEQPEHQIPDINVLPVRPLVQTLASRDSWVRVTFHGKEPPTKAEIERTIELLCMIRNGWDD